MSQCDEIMVVFPRFRASARVWLRLFLRFWILGFWKLWIAVLVCGV